MKTHVVRVEKNKIIVDGTFIADFKGRNKNTIRGWTNSKGMPVFETDDRGKNFFNLMEVHDWIKINISRKFNKNKSSEIDIEEEDDFKLDLPYDLELADIDLEDSLHLSILAAHPFGEMIRDTLKFVQEQEKREIEINTKEHDYNIKKGMYLKVEELNARMTEFMALVKDSDVNARAKFPIEIADELISSDLVKKEDKEKIQEIIRQAVDEVQEEKYNVISSQFMKHIVGKTKKITVEFLNEMIELIKGEKDD